MKPNLQSKRSTPALVLLPLLVANLALQAAEPSKTNAEALKSSAASDAKASLLVADFEKGAATTLSESEIVLFTDSSAGGKSTATIAVTDHGAAKSKGALVITGKLTPDFTWGGFCGIHALVQLDGGPKDLSAYTGVQFYARGDGKKYRVLVGMPEIQDGNHFAREFTAGPEWTLVKVPFAQLEQSPYFGHQVQWSSEKINGVGFLARAEPGTTADIRLEVDEIGFYVEK